MVSVPLHRFTWTGTAEQQCDDLKVLLAEQGMVLYSGLGLGLDFDHFSRVAQRMPPQHRA